MAKLDQLELPNGVTYDLDDRFARKLTDNDFDTINVTEFNAGNVIVTGVGRFINGLYGNLTGNADTATSAIKATQDESGNNIKDTYANSFSISDHIITLKNKNGTSLGTVTVPDNNTTYTIGTNGNTVTLTPSSGNVQSITVPYATSAESSTLAITASKLGSSNVGLATQPIYLSAGTATACTYSLNKTVPSDAVFTDTKNTAGSTDTSSKIYLVGATSQAANPQTYSDNEVYATSGVLTTKSIQVGGGSATMQYNSTTKSIDFVFI